MAIALRVLAMDEARVMATYSSHRSSSISAQRRRQEVGLHAAVDDVQQMTDFHSWPVAEWIVDRIR
jgi:hypothetical protein